MHKQRGHLITEPDRSVLVRPLPALVALQHRKITRRHALGNPRGQHTTQLRHIPQCQVKALSGNRMQGVGRVAHHHNTLADLFVGLHQRKRILMALADL